ncbi:MAG: Crp/Fnr family transcriptional regulator [Flavobacteriaceae bacterium]
MSSIDRSVIADLPPFQGMSPDDLDRMAAQARPQRFEREATIFSQGTAADRFYLLLSGHIRVVRTTPDGQQVIARYISPGELFGIAPALGLTAYPANAVAAAECTVLSWPTELWPSFADRTAAFGQNATATVGRRLQETQERVVEMSTERIEQRIAHTLLRLARQTGRKTDEGILIDLAISRQDIAEMTGTTLHTVSRLLSGWEGRGLVRSGRQRVTIVDPHRLLVLAEGRDKD